MQWPVETVQHHTQTWAHYRCGLMCHLNMTTRIEIPIRNGFHECSRSTGAHSQTQVTETRCTLIKCNLLPPITNVRFILVVMEKWACLRSLQAPALTHGHTHTKLSLMQTLGKLYQRCHISNGQIELWVWVFQECWEAATNATRVAWLTQYRRSALWGHIPCTTTSRSGPIDRVWHFKI